MKKQLLLGVLAAGVLLGLAACTQKTSEKASSQEVKIGILQQIDQQALDDTKKGILSELKAKGYKDAKIKVLNGQGDQANLNAMSQQLVSMKNNVNVSIGSAASQAMEKAGGQAPLVFSAITDPVAAGLIAKADLKHPTKNATGVTALTSVQAQLVLLHKMFPKATKIGMLYDAAEPNALAIVKRARKAMKALNMTPVEMTVASAADVESTTRALAKKVDAMYIPNDHVAAVGMATIGKVSSETKVPVVNSDPTMIQYAGVATKGASFEEIGKQTGRMVVKLLKGQKVKDTPVEAPEKVVLITNKQRMADFGVTDAMLK